MTFATTIGSAPILTRFATAARSFFTMGWYSTMRSSLVKSNERPAKSVLIAPGSTILTLTPMGLHLPTKRLRKALYRELGTVVERAQREGHFPSNRRDVDDDPAPVGAEVRQES